GQAKAAVLYDEKCTPAASDDRFSTFGGEKVTTLEAAIKGGKVTLIYVKTEGRYSGGLETSMADRYGKPKEARGTWRDGSYMWERGGPEYVSLGMRNGVNEVVFGFDN